MSGQEWRESAACQRVDSEIFFPSYKIIGGHEAAVRQAKSVCAGCLVARDCLAYAEKFELAYSTGADRLHGIWGGLTRREHRERIRARAQMAVNA